MENIENLLLQYTELFHKWKKIDQEKQLKIYSETYHELEMLKLKTKYHNQPNVSLEFKNNQLKIQKDKEVKFSHEYFGNKKQVDDNLIYGILEIVNISLSNCIESNEIAEQRIQEVSNDEKSIALLSIFIKEACGEDYSHYIKRMSIKV